PTGPASPPGPTLEGCRAPVGVALPAGSPDLLTLRSWVLAEHVLDGHGLGGQPLSELPDGCSGEATVPTERPDVGQLAFLGPPRHRLGRYVKQPGNLRREKVLILPSVDHG